MNSEDVGGSSFGLQRIILDIVSRLQVGQSMVQIPGGQEIFYLLQNAEIRSEAHPASYLMCNIILSLWGGGNVKCTGHEVDHFFQSNAEVKNEGNVPSTPSVCLNGMGRDRFIFTMALAWRG